MTSSLMSAVLSSMRPSAAYMESNLAVSRQWKHRQPPSRILFLRSLMRVWHARGLDVRDLLPCLRVHVRAHFEPQPCQHALRRSLGVPRARQLTTTQLVREVFSALLQG